MRVVRFIRDTDPHREGATFKEGETALMRPDRAAKWIRRSAAVYVPDPKPVEAESGNTVDSAPAVAGEDDSDTGAGTEPVAEPMQQRRRGRPPGNRDK